jgi:hypothetical protein
MASETSDMNAAMTMIRKSERVSRIGMAAPARAL